MNQSNAYFAKLKFHVLMVVILIMMMLMKMVMDSMFIITHH